MLVEGSGETSDRCAETSVAVEFGCMSGQRKRRRSCGRERRSPCVDTKRSLYHNLCDVLLQGIITCVNRMLTPGVGLGDVPLGA